MAAVARPQHQNVQKDGAVVERRLRPIYEWLDNGNYKKALQEAEKVLRKTPSLQTARALRALAMLRLGRAGDALAALASLAAERPRDETTLQAMTISYRELQQLRKVCELYEAAVRVESPSEDMYTHLFMAYVRVGDLKAQQQTAVALYKLSPKRPYYFWAVVSIVLQAKETEDEAKRGILLSLAQRMVDKFIADKKLQGQQEARLYIMILQLQDKYEEILNFMETPLYRNMIPGDMPAATLPYLRLLGRWRQLNTLCKDLLWDNLDRWDYYEPYLESTFRLMPEGAETPEGCHEFICQLIEQVPAGRLLRGPYLARLELYRRLLDSNKEPEVLMGGALDLCVEYLRVFAHKPCCVVDLKPYLRMIPQPERAERSREFLTCLGLDEHTMPETLQEVQRHVSCVGVWRLCGGAADAAALAGTLRSHYLRARARGLAPSTATEFPAADTYVVLAARHYYQAAMEQQSAEPLLEALSLLELVLHNSPANFHCRLLALKLYHFLGNGCAADSVYAGLEVKHVQLSSLGWLHAARLLPAGLPARALHMCSHTRRFHTHHTRDSVDHLTYSYKFGTFEKLHELMEFLSRVERCAWCAAAGLEIALLELLTGAGGTFNPPPAYAHTLSDNRDLSIMTSYDPPHLASPSLQEETFQHELAHLRLRSSIVNAVALSIELASACAGAGAADKPLDKDALCKELEEWLARLEEEFRGEYAPVAGADLISSPFPSRIIALVNSPVPYRELYVGALRLPAALARAEPAAARAHCERLAALLASSRDALHAQLDARPDSMWNRRHTLETITNYIEMIGIVTLALSLSNELTSSPSKGRRRRAGGEAAAATAGEAAATAEAAAAVAAAAREALAGAAAAEARLAACAEPAVPPPLAELLERLALHERRGDPLEGKLRAGHAAALADLRAVLAAKVKLLNAVIQ